MLYENWSKTSRWSILKVVYPARKFAFCSDCSSSLISRGKVRTVGNQASRRWIRWQIHGGIFIWKNIILELYFHAGPPGLWNRVFATRIQCEKWVEWLILHFLPNFCQFWSFFKVPLIISILQYIFAFKVWKVPRCKYNGENWNTLWVWIFTITVFYQNLPTFKKVNRNQAIVL